MSRGWRNPSTEKRCAYIAALQSRPRALTATEIAHMLDVGASTALQMLYALERDEVVERKPGGGKNVAWALTGKPLAAPSARGQRTDLPPRFDPCALAEALGMVPRLNAVDPRVVMLGDRRK